MSRLLSLSGKNTSSDERPLQAVVEENVELLRQAAAVVQQLSDDVFTTRTTLLPESTVGTHVRHCLDAYHCLLRDLAEGSIDYDDRMHERRTEQDRVAAVDVAQSLMSDLLSLDVDRPLLVRVESRTEAEAIWARSTLVRELDAAANHTIHHCAIIGMLLRAHGLTPPDHFGVSPSTMRFRERLQVEQSDPA